MLAKDFMTKDVIVVRETDTIEEVAKILIEKKISGVPVVDAQNKIIGVISEADLVFQQKKIVPPVFFGVFDSFFHTGKENFQEELKKISAYNVKNLMTKERLILAKPETELSALAELMIENKINRIPIINEHREVVGIVTRHDIVRASWKKE